jgi:hypothetical protein
MEKRFRQVNFESLSGCEGKGNVGCLLSILLLLVAIFAGAKLIPIYYSNSNFESDVKTEASRAGAHFFDDGTIVKDVLDLAKRNDLRIKRENIKIERFAGQVHLQVTYNVPVDLVIYKRIIIFHIVATSLVGSL